MRKIVFKPLGMTNTYVFYEKDKSTATPSYRRNSMVNWDYLDAIYGDKNIYSTPETFKV
jgi:CubicO group peptidase (beta-lactamase class C family)